MLERTITINWSTEEMSGVESMLIGKYFICLHLRRITDKTFDPIKDINSSRTVDDKCDELAELHQPHCA